MLILAHRANIDGPNAGENSLGAIAACLQRGFGLELDIRQMGDGFYFSHDPAQAVPDAREGKQILELLSRSNCPEIAVNLKELGYERELVEELAAFRLLDRSFIFDMELIEPNRGETAAIIRAIRSDVRLACRVSDRGEPLEHALADPATLVWLDEFDSLWVTRNDVDRLLSAGKRIYAVSPELHAFSHASRDQRWSDFTTWGVHGICTDYPALLEQFCKT